MNPAGTIVSLRFREMLQYRAAAWAGLFTQIVFGFIILMSLTAFYVSATVEPPLSREQLVVYIWIGQALFTLIPWNVDRSVQEMVRSGTVAYELVRPMDIYALWFYRTMGWRFGMVFTRAVPLLVLVGLIFPWIGMERWALPPPAGFMALSTFVVAIVLAGVLAVAITMLMQVVILWTLDAEGVTRIVPAFIMVLSGMIIPLPLFPDFLQPLFKLLPFRGLLDVPVRLYSGHIPTSEAAFHILLSAAWVVVLIVLGKWIMSRGLRQVVIQGG